MACLLFCEFAAFDVIGVVSEVNLCVVVNTSFESACHLLLQYREQGHDAAALRFAGGQGRLLRNIPCFSGQKGAGNFAACTIVACGAFCNSVFIGKLCSRNILHYAHFIAFLADIGKKNLI